MFKLLVILLTFLVGCTQEQQFHDGFRTYGEPTATSVKNDIIEDFFIVDYLEPVDILFIIDDSCSMDDDQEKLGENLPVLARELLRLEMNYRIAFTTTSNMDDPGHLRRLPAPGGYTYWITPDTRTKNDLFMYGAMPGIRGDATEAGLSALYGAFTVNNSYGFFRHNSSFHTVIVTDEPDQSYWSYYSDRILPVRKLIKKLNSFRKLNSVSIIGDEYFGSQAEYKIVSRKTGGFIIELESNDWSSFLVNFANSIEVDDSKYRFNLTRIPADPTDITIYVCEDVDFDGKCVPWSTEDDITYLYEYGKDDWSYVYDPLTNSLTLDDEGRELLDTDEVTIIYEVATGTPINN